jgi:1-deoxy-D-xylulose-5-phosphate synthase
LVILNDNDMSISPPVGALNRYLAELMGGRFYAQAKKLGEQVLRNAPPLFALAKHLEEQTQNLIQPHTIFEKLGFTYTGPVDGHDVQGLVDTLQKLHKTSGPQFLHVVTRKGKGYAQAELDPVAYHGPGKFDPAVGLRSAGQSPVTFTQVFGQWLCDMADKDPRLVAITPAMREGSGMVEFHHRFPDRYHDVGIAEQHSLTFAAGLACEGLKPVVAIYSTFLQRAYDQLIHDVALQKLPMVLALDRAGIVGADGPTHAGVYDIPFLRCIPQVSIACPADENECRMLLSTAHAQDHTVAVRYPRGSGVGTPMSAGLPTLPFGKGEMRRQGKGVAMLAFGTMLYPALTAAENLNASVANMRWAKPLDTELLLRMAASHEALVTVEEGALMGGAGSAVLEALQDAGINIPVLRLGVPDVFTEHGDPQKILSSLGLDAKGIEASIKKRFALHLKPTDATVNPSLKLVG